MSMVYTIDMQKANSLTNLYLGLLIIISFFIDAIFKIFVFEQPGRVLWYSTLGLLFMAAALFRKSSFMSTAVISAFFFLEGLWTIGFFYILIFQESFFGFSPYAFSLDIKNISTIVTLYHLLFLPVVVYLYINLKKVSPFGWVGASLFALATGLLTYFFNNGPDNVNCIYSVDNCAKILNPLYSISNPLRIFAVVAVVTFFVYIPTNIILWQVKKSK